MKLLQSMVSTISRAMLARTLFAAHSIVAISQMVQVYGETAYWGFTLLTCSIFIEGFLTIIQREGQETKWFCPCVFLYLSSVVPPIWYLQLDLSNKRLQAFQNNTTYEALEKQQATQTQLEMRFKMSHELWIQMLEQTLLVVLIVGRWLLPKGDITREQLSQILLAYLAIASDIVELFDVFKEDVVNKSSYLPKAVLAVWTMSVMQFPLVLTTSKARKMRVALTTSNSDEEIKRLQYMADCEVKARPRWVQAMGDVDIWAIVVACFLQDLPFLAVRAYLMINYRLMSYTMIFFTCKNVLVNLLQLYRLFVILHERYQGTKIEEDARRLTQHYRQMLHACKDVLTKLKEEGTSQVQNITSGRGRQRKGAAGHSKSKQTKTGNNGSGSGSGGSGSGRSPKRSGQRKFEDIQETDETSMSPKSDKRIVVVVTEEPKATVKMKDNLVENGGKNTKTAIIEIEKISQPTAIVHQSNTSPTSVAVKREPPVYKEPSPVQPLVPLADMVEISRNSSPTSSANQCSSPMVIESRAVTVQQPLIAVAETCVEGQKKPISLDSGEDLQNGRLATSPK